MLDPGIKNVPKGVFTRQFGRVPALVTLDLRINPPGKQGLGLIPLGAGLVALGQMWLLIVEAALRAPDEPDNKARLLNAQFFFERILPETRTRVARIMTPSAGLMEFHPMLDA